MWNVTVTPDSTCCGSQIFDKPDQNIHDGHGPQVLRCYATAVGPAPAPVQEESVADSVDGDEEENDDICSVQHDLTNDGHGCHVMGRVNGKPVLYQRKEKLLIRVQEYEDVKAIDEEENDDASLVQYDLTHDGHGCHGQSESSVVSVLGGYAGSSRGRN